jgi:hypothetical protein
MYKLKLPVWKSVSEASVCGEFPFCQSYCVIFKFREMIGPDVYCIGLWPIMLLHKNCQIKKYKIHLAVPCCMTFDIINSSCVFTAMAKRCTAYDLSRAVHMHWNGAKLRNKRQKYPEIPKQILTRNSKKVKENIEPICSVRNLDTLKGINWPGL